MKRSVWLCSCSVPTLLLIMTHRVMISSNSESDTSRVVSSSPIRSGRTSKLSVDSHVSLTAAGVRSSSACSEVLRHWMNSARLMERAPLGFSRRMRLVKNFLSPLPWWKKTACTLGSCVRSLIWSSSSPVAYGKICACTSLLNWSHAADNPKFLRCAMRTNASRNSGSRRSASYIPSDHSSSCCGSSSPGRTHALWISKKLQFSLDSLHVRTKVASCFMLTASSFPSPSTPCDCRGRA
mmetsp:Transcript_19887/g.38674  ORF Transcript_19887/g.38674 Transcript_19887/m.38674 type:complete len:238 (-) Transcript_19887:592-1305(-)